MTTKRPAIVWFRKDLRLADNPALDAAIKTGAAVIPLYILDEHTSRPLGAASKWWLHQSLLSLDKSFKKVGATLILRRGRPKYILQALIEETSAEFVFWNRRYHQPEINADRDIKASLTEQNVTVETFNGSLLREPWELKTKSGSYYRVFTPFWKQLRQRGPARIPERPEPIKVTPCANPPYSDDLNIWGLLPKHAWTTEIAAEWSPGEANAHDRLDAFLHDAVAEYADRRDYMAQEVTSRLSPHLAFGEIGPTQIWRAVEKKCAGNMSAPHEKFLSEIAWREFSYNLLFHIPSLTDEPLREQFTKFTWRDAPSALNAWQKGKTGYPVVDAAMRQLWRTGWMHNRARMIVASFLVKHLLINWKEGAAWFWDTLVDADMANNTASWQWVAGCGADAAPYYRIFNPITQSEKFDPNGDYVRRYIPELAGMPNKYIHAPWNAPAQVLSDADVLLGENYPKPIVDHAQARARALGAYEQVKSV